MDDYYKEFTLSSLRGAKMDVRPPDALKPWIDLFPPGGKEFLNKGGWLLVVGILLLLFLLLLVWSSRGLFRLLFAGRRKEPLESDRDFREDLSNAPLPIGYPGDRRLTVYHVPVRMRLVIVAPLGREIDVDATAVEKLLDQVVPGLSEVALLDRPKIRVWPAQLSHTGFATAFHRRMQKPEPDTVASRWVLVAGRSQMGRLPLLVGLALWADEPSMIGRLTLEPYQWLDVVRLRRIEE